MQIAKCNEDLIQQCKKNRGLKRFKEGTLSRLEKLIWAI